jgi:hypothetical protein
MLKVIGAVLLVAALTPSTASAQSRSVGVVMVESPSPVDRLRGTDDVGLARGPGSLIEPSANLASKDEEGLLGQRSALSVKVKLPDIMPKMAHSWRTEFADALGHLEKGVMAHTAHANGVIKVSFTVEKMGKLNSVMVAGFSAKVDRALVKELNKLHLFELVGRHIETQIEYRGGHLVQF